LKERRPRGEVRALVAALHDAVHDLGLSVVLVFVGVKFIWNDLFGKVPIWVSLPFIATALSVTITASLWKTRGQTS
jgi:predicted tellurium resistance membrane protein TerC